MTGPAMDTDSSTAALETQRLCKSFPGVQALDEVSLQLRAGKIHSLIGHNGAGKSTLVNLLAGVLAPDEGEILIDGAAVHFQSPADALRRGVGILFQQLGLLPNLTVAENIALETKRYRSISIRSNRQLESEAGRALQEVGLDVDPRAQLGSLSLPDQQLVAFARALQLHPRILVLDEPTSALSAHEVGRLVELLLRIRAAGVAILYITHRLHEVMSLSDEVTVLRDGRLVSTLPIEQVSSAQLVELMMGEIPEIERHLGQTNIAQGDLLFEIRDLRRAGKPILPDLILRAGEIVGLLGLPGSGRERVLYSILGLSRWAAVGSVRVGGAPVARNATALFREGVGVVPGDRHTEGVFPILSISDNVAVGLRRLRGWMRHRDREASLAQDFATQLRIRARNLQASIGTLSGGNQQKVILARVLAAGSRVLVMDEPTLGIDVGSRQEIYRIMREFADKGAAILVGSSDPEELATVADRILVIHDGTFEQVFVPPFDISELMGAAMGSDRSHVEMMLLRHRTEEQRS